jgi:hypothetical protein
MHDDVETPTMKFHFSLLAVAALTAGLLFTQAGCSDTGDTPAADNPLLATPVPAGMIRGTVLETMDSGGYTYAHIDTGAESRWIASSQSAVAVGDVVQVGEGMPMSNFTSKTLNRTFEVIYFTGGLQNLTAAAVSTGSAGEIPEGHPAVEMPANHPDVEAARQAASGELAVEAVEAGQDIAYVYANKDSLAGQQVTLRGKVVKYNDGILGWNFIHLQDGSGDSAAGSNDLTVTSKATTAVGETVVVSGTIILDKDFGAGYSFPVMMEDASVSTE